MKKNLEIISSLFQCFQVAEHPIKQFLKKYQISCTLFINGKCLETETGDVKKLLEFDVELGGHTYDNFGKMNIFKSYINRKLYGCVYGSARFQRSDILRTKRAFEKKEIQIVMSILSNYVPECLVRAEVSCKVEDFFDQDPEYYAEFLKVFQNKRRT